MFRSEVVEYKLKNRSLGFALKTGLSAWLTAQRLRCDLDNNRESDTNEQFRLLKGQENTSVVMRLVKEEVVTRVLDVPGRALRGLIRG
jgi:hypothetical protein